MKYYIGIDTLDLDDEYGYGVACVYGITERGSYFIQEEIMRQKPEDFYKEVERLKSQYQPSEIKEWA